MTVLLAIDTALREAIVAIGTPDGAWLGEDRWSAGYRHGEELLPRLRTLLAVANVELTEVAAVIVGTGPGAFTGLRVGIATAKALASGLGVPIVGVSTAEALLAAADAADDRAVPAASAGPMHALLLPAGPSDRVLVRGGSAALLPAGADLPADLGDGLVAVDLPDRASAEALARGQLAVTGLAAVLLRIGAERLARGDVDDLARLVPEYVTLPRGVAQLQGEVEWSHGLR